MTKKDAPELAKLLAILGEAFHEPVSSLRAEAYFAALDDLSIDQIKTAAMKALKTSKFFPRPAELRELITGNAQDATEAAWLALQREIRRVGYVGTPNLPEAILDAVSGVWGSWAHLCQTLPGEGPELLGWAKRFAAAYQVTVKQAEQPQLFGRAEAAGVLADVTEKAKALR